jgi:4-amino-4-deoxy-L-arabinose transferase-like glycosyltransferase
MTFRTRLLLLQVAELLGVCAFFFFFGLGAFGLVGADEPRYAQIAREMYQRHDWIVPTLNGSHWLEKPVLLYWKIMGSYMMYGVQDWVARLPAAFYATGLVLAIFFFMRRFRPGSELDAALIAVSMPAIFAFARAASTDMLLSAPFCVAMLAWWAWHETGKKFWLAGFYALLAVAALAKGPVAPALAVLIVGAYAALRRDGKIFVRSLWLPGFLLFFAISLPWYIAVQLKAPEFFRVFFVEHNLERFGTNLYQHKQPFWYYIPVFLLSVLPWIVFTLPALVESIRSSAGQLRKGAGSAHDQEQGASGNERLAQFLVLWIVIPIVFFSISRSKLPGYILPSIPPAAVLTAAYLHRRTGVPGAPGVGVRGAETLPRLQLMAHSLLCGVLLAGALLAPWVLRKEPLTDQARTTTIVATGVIATLVLIAIRRGGVRLLHFATLVPLVLGLGFLLRPAASAIDQTVSARAVDAHMRELGIKDTPVAVSDKREVEYGLNFYRNQRILNYERDTMPETAFVVVAREGRESQVQARVAPRNITKLGGFPPQHLEFFLVSSSK